MAAHFVNLIDAINTLPKARKVMAFSRADTFKIQVTRNTQGLPRFLIAMYGHSTNAANDSFRGFY